MPMVKETANGLTTQPLMVSREPVGPKKAGSKGSAGDRALMDAVAIVVVAWAGLWILWLSLRSVNV